MNGPPLLVVDRLCKRFGGVSAVADMDLTVPAGETLAIIGPNGAGKTTFYNLLSGRMKPSSGRITLRGRDITGLPPHRISRLGVSRSFQINNIFTEMTVRQNVEVAVTAKQGQSRRWANRASANRVVQQEAQSLLQQLGIAHLGAQPAGTISYGDKRLVEIAVVLATRPELVLLDEPTAGMTPEETARIIAMVRALAKTGRYTFLVTEHDMRVVFDVADRILVMHHGRELALGPPEAIRSNPDVRQAYLGDEETELVPA
ncbi:MAG: ABC transporter ATP-binding protein [Ottowia sp.]|nr:ABC transporter ATP-binding protein [Ottowia sp.]